MKVCHGCAHRFEAEGWKCPACGHSPPLEDGRAVLAPETATADGSDADYLYDALAAAEPWHFWFRSRRRLLLWALGRYFPSSRSFLEIGCGPGYVLAGVRETFPAWTLSGSEVRSDGLGHAARRLPGVALFQMDARRMPFEEEFDVMGAFDVLEHVIEDEVVLREMSRALRPGGGILLTVPQHPFLWSASDDFSHHKRRYTRAELVSKVERAGFEVLRVTSFLSLLLPLLLLARRKQRAPFDPEGELRIHPVANTVLGWTLGLERSLIRLGVSFAAGGSLLLAGRQRLRGPAPPAGTGGSS